MPDLLPSSAPTTTQDLSALRIQGLSVATRSTVLVDGVSLDVAPGERVGLIGESGSGKTLTALAVLGLLEDNLTATGRVDVGPEDDLLARGEREVARLRGRSMSMVFQEPMTALDPLMRVGKQVAEVVRNHAGVSRASARARAVELLAEVELPDPEMTARAYPHQLSGGQRQRVLIAMALANDPALLIADEPTTALDVTVQAHILDLLGGLVARRGAGLLFISHDLAVVQRLCEKVVVMKDGRIVEAGGVSEVFGKPEHEYTAGLLAASVLEPRGVSRGLPRDVARAGRSASLPNASRSAGPGLASVRAVTGASEPALTTSRSGPGTDPGPIIRLADVTRRYSRPGGGHVDALRGISFKVADGERFGLVGESGSGKTTTLRLLTGLDAPTSGTVEVAGVTLAGPSGAAGRGEVARVRALAQLVFQDPMGSLDPRMRVADIVAEPLLSAANRANVSEAATRSGRAALVREMLDAVGMPSNALRRYPHQFSGGQRQRISIARALVTRPRILVADEPVSALDVSVRAQVLDLLGTLATDRAFTLVLVSHDMAVIRHLCDRIAVMRDGLIVEQGETERVWASPAHEYTDALKAATPVLTPPVRG